MTAYIDRDGALWVTGIYSGDTVYCVCDPTASEPASVVAISSMEDAQEDYGPLTEVTPHSPGPQILTFLPVRGPHV